MRARLALAVAAVAALEIAGLALGLPPGRRLRPIVDLLAVEGIALAIVGAFLAADRPFLAAAGLRRRVREEAGLPAPRGAAGRPRRGDRSVGWVALALGGALFAGAALLWALWGGV